MSTYVAPSLRSQTIVWRIFELEKEEDVVYAFPPPVRSLVMDFLAAVGGGTQVVTAAGETAEKTLATQSSALGEGGCCSLSRPSDDLKIS